MNRKKKAFLLMLQNLIITLAIIWAVFTFFLGLKMAPNDDMSPRISAGDILLYYRLDKEPSSQDIIIVNKNDTTYVGRVVATEGDKVDISKKDNLIINGNIVTESNIFYTTPYYEGFVEYPVTLGKEECFILADKREGGEDSRYFGPIKKNEIIGTVIGQFRRSGI